jgi:hypothetical protein
MSSSTIANARESGDNPNPTPKAEAFSRAIIAFRDRSSSGMPSALMARSLGVGPRPENFVRSQIFSRVEEAAEISRWRQQTSIEHDIPALLESATDTSSDSPKPVIKPYWAIVSLVVSSSVISILLTLLATVGVEPLVGAFLGFFGVGLATSTLGYLITSPRAYGQQLRGNHVQKNVA